MPGEAIPTPVLSVPDSGDELWRRLLDASPPVVARRHEGALLVDLRTVDPADDVHVEAALS